MDAAGRGRQAQDENEALVDAALREAGIAEAMEIYEAAERIYGAIPDVTMPLEYASTSTTDHWLVRQG